MRTTKLRYQLLALLTVVGTSAYPATAAYADASQESPVSGEVASATVDVPIEQPTPTQLAAAQAAPDATPDTNPGAVLIKDSIGVAAQVNAQTAIAQCMKAAGFSYTPIAAAGSPSGDDISVDQVVSAPTSGRGYGVVANNEPASAPEDPALAATQESNDAYYSGLSPDSQAAYKVALNGTIVTGTGDGQAPVAGELAISQDPNFNPAAPGALDNLPSAGGCAGAAAIVVTDPAQAAQHELGSAIDEQVTSALATSPVVQDAQDTWKACMASNGRNYNDPQQPVTDLVKQAHDLAATDAASSSWDALLKEELAIASDDLTCRSQSNMTSAVQMVAKDAVAQVITADPSLVTQAAAGDGS